jgi:hypothetical protein
MPVYLFIASYIADKILLWHIVQRIFYGVNLVFPVNSTSDYTLWTFYRSYFNGIRANIEL